MAKGHKTGGRQRGSANKATKERLEQERVALQAQREVDKARAANTVLGKDMLERFMITFAGMAAHHQPIPEGQVAQPGRKPDESKFLTYAKLTVETARDLAQFQSPKFKAIQVIAPPANIPPPTPATGPGGNVITLDDPVALTRVYQQLIKQVR